jgi:hypothetical protein
MKPSLYLSFITMQCVGNVVYFLLVYIIIIWLYNPVRALATPFGVS